MQIRKCLLAATTIVLTGAFAATGAVAAEQKDSGTACWGGEPVEVIAHSDGVVAGISKWSNSGESKANGKYTERCVGVWSVVEGEFQNVAYCIGSFADGTRWFNRTEAGNAGGSGSTLVRSDGVTGSFSWANSPDYPQVTQDAFAGCADWEGTWTKPE